MFSYYGSKSKIIDCYPPPKYSKIIEPFAGSARYSLKYFDRDILLIDKYSVIIDIWKWLQKCSIKDIKMLPVLKKGDDLRLFTFDCQEALNFMRFHIGGGLPAMQWIKSWDGSSVNSICDNLFKIKHWQFICGDYTETPDITATIFVDPPYQFGGHKYKESNKTIHYDKLANWCKERQGQIIVCENSKADWMDFKPMKDMKGARFKTKEVIWSNERTAYDDVQQTLYL